MVSGAVAAPAASPEPDLTNSHYPAPQLRLFQENKYPNLVKRDA
jgi:hypothetical protein